MKTIPYARQSLNNDDIREAVKALKSDWITQGPRIKMFEEALSRYTGARYAVALSSGTAALHLAMLALGIGKGDKVITAPITFSASASCALYVGARPAFVDINDRDYHIDVEKLKSFLSVPSRRKGVKAVVPVHLTGTVCRMEEIKKVCDRYGIKIVEDAAHALGAWYRTGSLKAKVGGSKHSNATIFSFHPIKHITTGEGGAFLTNSKMMFETVGRLRHHGIVKKGAGPWSYDIPSIGYNYRITDFQSAIGMSQLKKLDSMVNTRRSIVDLYNEHFAHVSEIRTPWERERTRASYHLYVIRVPSNKRGKLYDHLKSNGILTQVNYAPVHLFSYYRKHFGYRSGDLPVAERYARECLSLPLYIGLTRSAQLRVIRKVKEFFAR
ncbi:MAG: UDP-4-amino-4,6-dideoxy-N-acetyl-beta-L-altrosamine transaminase [Candidatus Omnitrophota bacterium]